ncbi:MAG: hypothetical protein ACT4N2_06535 [Hyphomicrobium sp.]
MQETGDEDIIRALRARSHRVVQTLFASLAGGAIAAGLAVHHAPAMFGLAGSEPEAIAHNLLAMGLAYVATMVVWDWLYD